MRAPFFLLISVLSIALSIVACGKDDNDQESSNTGQSHNAGRNCLSCHSFKLAGSVYSSDFSSTLKGTTVILTTEANGGGSIAGTFTTDKTGNFYTSSSVSFGNGLYAGVKGSGSTYRYMSSTVTSGACNSCHSGTGTEKIWAE